MSLPSRFAFFNGNWHPSTKYDENSSAVMSVYAPDCASSDGLLPAIVWVHGGAWVTGGSQPLNYDGTKLAQDAAAIVVCIIYRLGALGFLHDESRSLDNGRELPAGKADVVAAFRWVRANMHAFEGDPSNITTIGQMAGAHQTQALLATRPDLLEKAVLISSPAGLTNPPSSAAKAREDLIAHLPNHAMPETASIDILRKAQIKAVAANPSSLSTWGPTTTVPLGFVKSDGPTDSKQVLIGWTAIHGKVFLHLVSPEMPVAQLSNNLTDKIFRGPSIALAKQLREQGHAVMMFELTWTPEGSGFGPTHCIDLPLTSGSEAWSRSPICWRRIGTNGKREGYGGDSVWAALSRMRHHF